MLFKILKSIIRKKDGQKIINADELSSILDNASDGFGEFASSLKDNDQDKKDVKSNEMLVLILDSELKANQLNNSKLFYSLAVAYENYCAWFIRGDERKQFFEKTSHYLSKSIATSLSSTDAKIELARLLINEKAIRDLAKGIKIIERLKKDGEMPSHLNSLLTKARRQLDGVKLDRNYDLCKITDPSPAVFREERKRFRSLISEYKKKKV